MLLRRATADVPSRSIELFGWVAQTCAHLVSRCACACRLSHCLPLPPRLFFSGRFPCDGLQAAEGRLVDVSRLAAHNELTARTNMTQTEMLELSWQEVFMAVKQFTSVCLSPPLSRVIRVCPRLRDPAITPPTYHHTTTRHPGSPSG